MAPKCASCHGPNSPDGGYDLSTYTATMAGGRVVPGNPEASVLYQRVIDRTMPPGQPLSPAEIAGLRDWIANGAQSTGAAVTPPPPPPPANAPPMVNAGADKSVMLPIASVAFGAVAADTDGTIASMQWSKVSGPGAVLTGVDTLNLSVSGLNAGVYVFKFSAVDDKGAEASDQVQLTVLPAPNQAPVASAGADKTITLPVSTTSFTGTGTDADGTIAAYLWSQVSGPVTATITNGTTATAAVSGLTAVGVYVFRLRVTDNLGASATDDVQVFVNAANNLPPVVNAGANQAIMLPVSSVTVTGTASDPDGTIAALRWSQVAGPATVTIATPTQLSSVVNGFIAAGTYTLQLQATDNSGANSVAMMSVTVTAAANVLPTANAGGNKSITQPASSITLTGTGTDPDGTIAAYNWRQVSGPGAATLQGANTNVLVASNLVVGTYVFELQVTDNRGGTATAQAQVSVLANPNAKFSWINANILQPKCLSCHGAGNAKGNYDVTNYTTTLKGVVAGNPNASSLYLRTADGSMPKAAPLSAAEIGAIKNWIEAGGLNN